MTMDPRTPVLVGGAQLNLRDGGMEPIDMIATAARAAADDAGTQALLDEIDSVRLVRMLSWKYRDPGVLLAERLGITIRHSSYTGNGGNAPQTLVSAAAADIAAGRIDAALVGGAEAWRTRMKLRAAGERPDWTVQGEQVAPASLEIPEVPMVFDGQKRIGLDRPAFVYPLFEQAVRIAAGRTVDEQLARAGDLWSSFSCVAAQNEHAWTRRAVTAEDVTTPSADNRWIAWPYTKLMNSNNMVEQAAVVLLCSARTATRLGISRDQWVFPQSAADAHDTYDIAERAGLDRSPAIRIAGAAALDGAGMQVDQLDLIDLYSCFPSAVQVAAAELGLTVGETPLTVTGGLTFAGGPWNNYSTHAIATMAERLRAAPGSTGLVTANGGYLTKHAICVYGTEPPPGGFRHRDVQSEVDALATTAAQQAYTGRARVESWSVAHSRDGRPERAFLSVRTPDGDRAFAGSAEPDLLESLVVDEWADRSVDVDSDGQVRAG